MWNLNDKQNQLINTTYRKMLSRMIRGGFQQNQDYHYKITNSKLHEICKTEGASDFVARQQVNYCAHLVRQQNTFSLKDCCSMTTNIAKEEDGQKHSKTRS